MKMNGFLSRGRPFPDSSGIGNVAETDAAARRTPKLILPAPGWAASLRSGFRIGSPAALVVALLLQALICVVGSTVVNQPDLASLSGAIQAGGIVTLAFDGTIQLNESFTISKNTTLDGGGHVVRLDGGNLVRHFVVTNGATLRLVNLTLANGRFKGRDGQVGAPSGGNARAGSIFNTGGNIELVSCRFLDNQVRAGDAANVGVVSLSEKAGGEAFGGAIYSVAGAVAATNCVFAGNHCVGGTGSSEFVSGDGGDAHGGAMYLTNSRLSLDAVVFTNNVVQGGEFGGETKHPGGGGSGLGGALAVELSPGALSNSIIRSVFSENRAYGATRTVRDLTRSHADGGALYCGRGSLSIEQTLFSQNVALGGPGYGYAGNPAFGDGRGGAISNRDGELTIRDSAIVFNQANGGSLPELWSVFNAGAAGTAWGGAIHNHGTLAVRNSTLSENVATGGAGYAYALPGPGYGGAILNEGSISLLNVTMGKNYANAGSAGGYQGPAEARGDALATVSGTVALTNTILFSAQGRTNVWGTILDGGHNISSDGSALFTSLTSKNNVDPLLGPLGNNGGLTRMAVS